MFTKACAIAGGFTLPVVISNRLGDGQCSSMIGACVVVNRDGWVLTVAHLMREIQRQQSSTLRHLSHHTDVRELEQDIVSNRPYRQKRVRTLNRPGKSAIRNHSVWWGRDGAQLRDAAMMPAADLALGRLEPFDPDSVAHYPVFKNPARDYAPGRSLCRLGFPFHKIQPTYDEEKNAFVLPKGAVPLPLFPLEGIFTRVVIASMQQPEKDDQSAAPGKFIETSSPGLAGQSGGPIVDIDGVVWGLQSHTRHYSLGFDPHVPTQRKSNEQGVQKEHQFLNVGLGVHAEMILNFLKQRGVEHRVGD